MTFLLLGRARLVSRLHHAEEKRLQGELRRRAIHPGQDTGTGHHQVGHAREESARVLAMDEAGIAPDHLEAALQLVVVFLLASSKTGTQLVFLDSSPQASLVIDFNHQIAPPDAVVVF
jgi:hypothetical protein